MADHDHAETEYDLMLDHAFNAVEAVREDRNRLLGGKDKEALAKALKTSTGVLLSDDDRRFLMKEVLAVLPHELVIDCRHLLGPHDRLFVPFGPYSGSACDVYVFPVRLDTDDVQVAPANGLAILVFDGDALVTVAVWPDGSRRTTEDLLAEFGDELTVSILRWTLALCVWLDRPDTTKTERLLGPKWFALQEPTDDVDEGDSIAISFQSPRRV